MKTEDTQSNPRPKLRTRTDGKRGTSGSPMFGDTEWVAEHLDWIRQHYLTAEHPRQEQAGAASHAP